MHTPVNILIVDDHALVRAALAERLAREPGFCVLPSAADADTARQLIACHQPDVILMDIDLAGSESLAVTGELLGNGCPARIIFVTGLIYDRYIDFALERGVRGFVSKGDSPDVLVTAVRAVMRDQVFYSAEVRRRIAPTTPAGGHATIRTRGAVLTPRQRQILGHIAQGKSKSQMAYQIGVSVKTVETHCQLLMDRLGLRDRVALARFAIRERLIEP
jgi:DNA-binding NarL/FixJ family response regulator